MKIKELLPHKTTKKSFRGTIKSLAKGETFCLESFSSYLERHERKGKLNRKKTLQIFIDYPLLSGYEFVREYVRNYLLENGSVFINNFKTLSLGNKTIKEDIYSSYHNNKYYPIYHNSITGRLFSNYQSWPKINQKHTLHHLSKEKLISVDVKSCVLSVYLNFLTMIGEDVTDIKNMIYQTDKDPYIYFFIKTLLPSVLESHNSYNETDIYRFFLDRKGVLEELVSIAGLEKKAISKEYVLKVIKKIGKTILIAYMYQGTSSCFKEMVKLLGIKKNILDYRIINSPFKLGKWNRFIYNISKQLNEGLVLERVYNLYIPPLTEYFNKESRISAYILENLANYSVFSAMAKMILRDIPLRAYYFDEVLLPEGYLEYKEDIKQCFLHNNLMPLKIRFK